MQPAAYWRSTKTWPHLLGKTGTVVACSLVRVAEPSRAAFTPYPLVIVDFGEFRQTLVGTGNKLFQPGQIVKCVLRKMSQPASHDLIPYGIKVTPA